MVEMLIQTFKTNLFQLMLVYKCMCIFGGNAATTFIMSLRLCALIYNNYRLITDSLHLTKIMKIGDELQHAVLSTQDDH